MFMSFLPNLPLYNQALPTQTPRHYTCPRAGQWLACLKLYPTVLLCSQYSHLLSFLILTHWSPNSINNRYVHCAVSVLWLHCYRKHYKLSMEHWLGRWVNLWIISNISLPCFPKNIQGGPSTLERAIHFRSSWLQIHWLTLCIWIHQKLCLKT